MSKGIEKQLMKVEKQENKCLQNSKSGKDNSESSIKNKIEDKIPVKLRETLYLAFYKAFKLVFEKGTDYIEKTYNKEDMKLEHDLNDIAIDQRPTRKYIKRMDKQSNKSKFLNTSIATVEGSVLGLLGIGIPDIPVIISLIIRQLYEISLSYGYDYERDEEKAYILLIICGSLTKGTKQLEFNRKIDDLGATLDKDIVTDINLEDQIEETANILADELLVAKFIQGIPVVGLVGGVVNNKISFQVGKYGKIKYKKRYLLSKST